jgi:hypothetical protein
VGESIDHRTQLGNLSKYASKHKKGIPNRVSSFCIAYAMPIGDFFLYDPVLYAIISNKEIPKYGNVRNGNVLQT